MDPTIVQASLTIDRIYEIHVWSWEIINLQIQNKTHAHYAIEKNPRLPGEDERLPIVILIYWKLPSSVSPVLF